MCGIASTAAPNSEATAQSMRQTSALMRWFRAPTLFSGGHDDATAVNMSLWHRGSGFDAGEIPNGDPTVDRDSPFPVDGVFGEGRAPAPSTAFVRPGQYVMDMCLVIDGVERVPAGYEDSGVVMAAVVNGTAVTVRVCLLYSGAQSCGALPFEGSWATSDGGVLEVRCVYCTLYCGVGWGAAGRLLFC